MPRQPISMIAVKDVPLKSKLLCELFDWKSAHGGSEFDILRDRNNSPTLLLHSFEAHSHNRFKGAHDPWMGFGQTLYVFVEDINSVYERVLNQNLKIIETLFLNKNSDAIEFTFKVDEGHQFSVCEGDCWVYHRELN